MPPSTPILPLQNTNSITTSYKCNILTVAFRGGNVRASLVLEDQSGFVRAALGLAGRIVAVPGSPVVAEGEGGALERAGYGLDFRVFSEHAVERCVAGDSVANVLQGRLLFAKSCKMRIVR